VQTEVCSQRRAIILA